MSTILNRMKKLKEEKNKEIIKDHPVANESIAIKMQYLNGLALMMNVDEDIADVEKEFFIALIEGFGLESSVIEDFISFAKDPDAEEIDELFEELSKTELTKFYFVLDSYTLAYKDETVTDEEKELIDMFIEMLNFEEKEIELFNTIKQQNYKNTFVLIGNYFRNVCNDNANDKEAFKWYKLAAEQGDVNAKRALEELNPNKFEDKLKEFLFLLNHLQKCSAYIYIFEQIMENTLAEEYSAIRKTLMHYLG